MAEILRVIFTSPWHFFGTLILIFMVGAMVNLWVNTYFTGKWMRGALGWSKKEPEQKRPSK